MLFELDCGICLLRVFVSYVVDDEDLSCLSFFYSVIVRVLYFRKLRFCYRELNCSLILGLVDVIMCCLSYIMVFVRLGFSYGVVSVMEDRNLYML